MNTIKIHVPVTEQNGWFIAECPSMPGVVTQGRTQEELITNLRESIGGWLEVNDERAMASNPVRPGLVNQELQLGVCMNQRLPAVSGGRRCKSISKLWLGRQSHEW